MSGTVLDHRLVRDYLCQLDAAMRGLPLRVRGIGGVVLIGVRTLILVL